MTNTNIASDAAITIEDNIPLAPRASYLRVPKYRFNELEIGQSFFVPGKTMKTFANTCSAKGKRYGVTFSARAVTEKGVEGVRVWRVAPTVKTPVAG